MSIMLDSYIIPEKGLIEFSFNRSFEIKVTAALAQRKVNHWLHQEVSYMMGTDSPILVIGETIIWRVPAWISFPDVGRAGLVGQIDVDVKSGEINITPECKMAMKQQAEQIANRLPPYQPKMSVSPEFLVRQD